MNNELKFSNESKVKKIYSNNDEVLIVNSARVSMNKAIDKIGPDDIKLLQYLFKHNHFSPFSHAKIASVKIMTKKLYSHYLEYNLMNKYLNKDFIVLHNNNDNDVNSNLVILLEISSLYAQLHETNSVDLSFINAYKFKNILKYKPEFNSLHESISNNCVGGNIKADDVVLSYQFHIPTSFGSVEYTQMNIDSRKSISTYKNYVNKYILQIDGEYENLPNTITNDTILTIDYTHLVNMSINEIIQYLKKDVFFTEYLKFNDDETTLKNIAKRISHFTLLIKTPMPIRTQLYRSEYGFSKNEVSRRYVPDDIEFFIPSELRGKPDKSVKQGSSDKVVDIDKKLIEDKMNEYFDFYNHLIEKGVCVEQARYFLPQATTTQFYFTASCHNYDRILNLRLDDHAQYDIRNLASKIVESIYNNKHDEIGKWWDDADSLKSISRNITINK